MMDTQVYVSAHHQEAVAEVIVVSGGCPARPSVANGHGKLISVSEIVASVAFERFPRISLTGKFRKVHWL